MTELQRYEQNELNEKLALGQDLTHRESLILMYSDFHKDAYGFRPRTVNVYAMSTEALEEDYAEFERVCKENQEADAIAEAQADLAFQTLITNTIQMGAGDEVTALRWIAEGAVEQYGYDYEHFLWSQGIAYSAYGKAMAKKIAPIWGKALQTQKVA